MILWKQRILAALIPVATMIVGANISFFGFWCPFVCYLIFKNLGYSFAAKHAMKSFDICITAIFYAFGLSILQFFLRVISKDAGGNIPLISDGFIPILISIGVALYLLLAVVLLVIYPLLNKEFKMPFSVRLFEAFINYRSNKPIQPTAKALAD